MMRKLSSLLTGAALTLAAGLIGCTVDPPDDPFMSTTLTDAGDGDSNDGMMETGDSMGDGDGDTTGDGDGDTGCTPGTLGCSCDNGMCDAGLTCNADDECVLGGGDGDGDTGGDGDGDLRPCNADDPYCLANGCMMTMGQGLVLDTNMDGVNDWGWCLFACTDAAECPPHPAGGMATCEMWNMDGDMACFLGCDVNDPNSCAPGSECSTIAGPPICLYDASGF